MHDILRNLDTWGLKQLHWNQSQGHLWNTMGRGGRLQTQRPPPQVQSTMKTRGTVKEAENPEVEVSV